MPVKKRRVADVNTASIVARIIGLSMLCGFVAVLAGYFCARLVTR